MKYLCVLFLFANSYALAAQVPDLAVQEPDDFGGGSSTFSRDGFVKKGVGNGNGGGGENGNGGAGNGNGVGNGPISEWPLYILLLGTVYYFGNSKRDK